MAHRKPTKLSDLEEWGRNPRSISDKALSALGSSVKEFGDLSGIVFNVRLGALVCGHQRLKALRAEYGGKLKMSDGAILAPNGERFLIRYVDWPEQKHAAANIAANSPLLAGEFTDAALPILDELALELPDLSKALDLGALGLDLRAEIGARAGQEFDETARDGVELCVCERCGHEHARKKG